MKYKRPSSSLKSITAEQNRLLQEKVAQWDVPADELELVLRALHTLTVLFEKLSTLKMSIKQLRQMFHIKTEKKKTLYPEMDQETTAAEPAGSNPDDDSPGTASTAVESAAALSGEKKKRPGHGRIPAAAYTGAITEEIKHQSLSSHDRCPGCHRGALYDVTGPGFLHITASPALQATIYKQQKLRCNCCGELYYATLSKEEETKKRGKWAPSARAMIALLKYGWSFPYNRLSNFQKTLGIPLPPSTQWGVMERLAEMIYPVYTFLCYLAAQGKLIFNDDTFARILKIASVEQTGHAKERTGMYTTGIISHVGKHIIALYYTGRNHAGENLELLLSMRTPGRDPPIQMCDAAARNIPKTQKTLLANCLVHGRRKFVELMHIFTDDCQYMIEQLALVFKHDKHTRQENYTDEQRLKYHQQHSAPIMKELQEWMEEQFATRAVEPNSSLGMAFTYMLKRWDQLTLFLRVPGAPLHSNCVERALKRPISNRRNSNYFKTEKGAMISDMLMSIIETCRQSKVDPFHYLITLQEHQDELSDHPENWMPWNYRQNLEQAKAA